MLELRQLRSGYDGPDVLCGVDLSLEPGSLTAVIGANGAGKSTLLRTISGLLALRGGSIVVDGSDLSRGGPTAMVRAGIAHVPEGRQVFSNLSVEENLSLGAYGVKRPITLERMTKVFDTFPLLKDRLSDYAGSLSGGQQQMLAIGRGLMAEPKYLLLDEPSLGLAPIITERIFEVFPALVALGYGILLVEQNGQIALSIADRALLLERGEVTLRGSGSELLNNPEVIRRYLGVGTLSNRTDSDLAARSARLRNALGKEEGPRFVTPNSKAQSS